VDESIRERVSKVILDLSDVQRVDSTGFGTIVMCANKLKSAGGELRVAGAKGMVDEIAHTSNIPRVVPFHGTIEEAVNAMNTKADPGA
jgi:anti-anti-sigma factor